MKKHKLTALAAALCLLCTGVPFTSIPGTTTSLTASAADAEKLVSGAFTYTISNDTVTITGFDESTDKVEVPAEIDGMPVTAIGPTVFYGLTITSISLPDTITEIGNGAFWHAKGLTSIKLPASLTTLGNNVFNDCSALATIEFPESLTQIGSGSFVDTAWMAAQKEKSPYVVVNGILIDASAVVTNARDEVKAARANAEENAAKLNEWREPGKHNGIILNQVGFFPELTKKATLLSDSTTPVDFELVDADGKTVFTGKSKPYGADVASGDSVHIIDFTDFTKEGTYSLKAASGETSQVFTIGVNAIYSGLMYDALNYFYQNRSGIEIQSEFITSGNKEKLARGVAHNPDIATIQNVFDYEGSSGEQEVTGGWYDAGDHGKYVVNGGISLWMMQNQYERASVKGKTEGYADGAMKIPENGNGMPDLLDEARYEMEWMFTMLVQDGDYKNMAYHKIHDSKWTGLGLDPAKDVMARYLLPPSTAATLNVSACAAQASRLWKDLDPEFAAKCLSVAEDTYAAAKAHPAVYAPNKEHGGGGAYSDSNVTDEFYWAACELFAATGDEAYYDDMKASDYAFRIQRNMEDEDTDSTSGVFDWGSTAALGSLTLLLHPDTVSKEEIGSLRESLTSVADLYADFSENQGYGIPYGGYEQKNGYRSYVWGSNSFVVDDAVIMAYAYDETQDAKYLTGIVSAMDYVLGRNALDFSYVTGYGEHSAQYPHHRWWAVKENINFPKAPCGVLCGGPNSSFSDPAIADTELVANESPAQLCYIDNPNAYSVNECAINWNAPLAWVTGYLCEQTGGIQVGQESLGQQLQEPLKASEIPDAEIIVTVPDGVTAIGEQIFVKENGYVQEVNLPESVTKISKEAFYRCTKLSKLNIPEAIDSVGDNAFADTPWLKAMLQDTPLLVFNNILIDGTSAKGDVVVPDGVTSILGSAFKLNEDITSVVIPEGVTSIGEEAFQNCTSLASVSLPNSLEIIEANAFANTALTELDLPKSVKEVGDAAFINCKQLPEVTIKNKNLIIGDEAFGWTSTFTANGQYSYIFIHNPIDTFVVNCYEGSSADTYAKDFQLQTKYLEGGTGEDRDWGDMNGDKKLTIVDVIMLNQNIMFGAPLTDEAKKNADVDQNGKIDETDSLNMLKAVVEIITLPV